MWINRTALAAIALATAALGAGCGSNGGSKDSNGANKKVDVAFISYANFDYQQAEVQGMNSVLKKAGGSVRLFNANFDPAVQTTQCQDAVASGRYNAIILTGVSGPTSIPCVKAAAAAKIPVVAIDLPVGNDPEAIKPNTDGVVAQIVLTPQGNGKGVVELTKRACAGKNPCKIVAEIATPSEPLTTTAVKMVQEQVPGAEIVGKFASGYDVAAVAKAMPDQLRAHGDLDVYLSIADSSAIAALPAIKDAGLYGKINIVGNAGSRLGAKAVADGVIFGTLANWPQQIGTLAAKLSTKAVNGEKIETTGYDQTTDLDSPYVLDKSNIDQFTPEWGATA
jgi:ribose transport system substrate-binding protein